MSSVRDYENHGSATSFSSKTNGNSSNLTDSDAETASALIRDETPENDPERGDSCETHCEPIPGFPGYVATSDGHIRTVRFGRNRSLAEHANRPGGYLKVCASRDNKPAHVYVHHLVAMAFIGPRPEGAEVAHRDGDTSNNSPSNLMYATRAENERHKAEHGTQVVGEHHPSAKLTESDVREIRRAFPFERPEDIAKRYGVSHTAIRKIISGKTWKGVVVSYSPLARQAGGK